jgi:hypothetical protein
VLGMRYEEVSRMWWMRRNKQCIVPTLTNEIHNDAKRWVNALPDGLYIIYGGLGNKEIDRFELQNNVRVEVDKTLDDSSM